MRQIKALQKLTCILLELKRKKKRIGFIPTMGFLHEGHLSLIRRARKETDVVVVSIFVNPTQFGPKEDFKHYPRNLKRDLKLLSQEKVDFVLTPSTKSIYPEGKKLSFLNPGPLAQSLCGLKRPGHFRGVVTVVKRLFDIILPDVAYFGQKDYQQARVVQEMVKRFRLPIRVAICPTVREEDGLAMSSRNVYLTPEERLRARTIPTVLQFAKRFVYENHPGPKALEKDVAYFLRPYVNKIDYVHIVDTKTLRKIKKLKGNVLLAVACFVGKTRLIDNILIRV